MLTLTCIYVSESGKSASFSVTKDHGPVSAQLATGFMRLNDDSIEKGDTIELDYENVSTTESVTDDGQVFKWLVFE